MVTGKPSIRRCAVYTRKSSEEGLEQEFNSLHAQREACEAFIRSQRGEGWRLVEAAYDDGGISGGTMDRPALQQLLANIRAGQVDTVVVYKVDRLTRSLTDFVKMVEVFDAHGVSFVAVTQQFNTTTSMGRLTLNILLSFAQFEREVTGERIRDKIAASKRKGMWMGGNVPLGYDAQNRKLVINPAEADTVRSIFRRYGELGCVRRLKEDLDRRGIRSKMRIAASGALSGGQPFSRGALYTLLSNPVYIGETRHKDARHPGLHEAILDRALWEATQQRLRDNTTEHKARATKVSASPLAGKLVDEAGARLVPSHAVKNGRRYRYYVSHALVTGVAVNKQDGWRLPAREIEQAVAAAAQKILDDGSAIADVLGEAGISTNRVASVLDAARTCRQRLQSGADATPTFAALVDRVVVQRDGIVVTLSLRTLLAPAMDDEVAVGPFVTRHTPIQMKRRGVEMRLVIEGAGPAVPKADPALLKAVARAHRWFAELASGQIASVGEIADREGVSGRYVRCLLPLAFLSPDIVEAIANGGQPVDVTAETLNRHLDLDLDWAAQKSALGFA